MKVIAPWATICEEFRQNQSNSYDYHKLFATWKNSSEEFWSQNENLFMIFRYPFQSRYLISWST